MLDSVLFMPIKSGRGPLWASGTVRGGRSMMREGGNGMGEGSIGRDGSVRISIGCVGEKEQGMGRGKG